MERRAREVVAAKYYGYDPALHGRIGHDAGGAGDPDIADAEAYLRCPEKIPDPVLVQTAAGQDEDPVPVERPPDLGLAWLAADAADGFQIAQLRRWVDGQCGHPDCSWVREGI